MGNVLILVHKVLYIPMFSYILMYTVGAIFLKLHQHVCVKRFSEAFVFLQTLRCCMTSDLLS